MSASQIQVQGTSAASRAAVMRDSPGLSSPHSASLHRSASFFLSFFDVENSLVPILNHDQKQPFQLLETDLFFSLLDSQERNLIYAARIRCPFLV